MEKLIIKRSKWRTGNYGKYRTGEGDTYLRNDEGYMCCLGFDCLRRGLKKEDIISVGEPEELIGNEFKDKLGDMVTGMDINHEWINEAINVNDDEETTLLEKEILLKQLFSEQNIKVIFKD